MLYSSTLLLLVLLATTHVGLSHPEAEQPVVLIVIGAPGTSEYGERFATWADRWEKTAQEGQAEVLRVEPSSEGAGTQYDRLHAAINSRKNDASTPLWIVLIGHGTFDGDAAKYNLEGPDVAAAELAEWLEPSTRPLVIINCTSCSAPFINRLSGSNRVVLTATKSGYEQNYARFGGQLAEAIGDPAADLDQDEQVSLLEAFLTASKRVEESYRTDAQLATEHALLDDNGDQLGTPATFFRGIRATQRAKDGTSLDGLRSHQLHLVLSPREQAMPPEARDRRDELELLIEGLRDRKQDLDEDDYYRELESLMIELARLYRTTEALESAEESRPVVQPETHSDSNPDVVSPGQTERKLPLD